MRVLYVTAELHPFVKTGGLGDVSAALPAALRAQNIDVRLLLPALPAISAGMPAAKAIATLPSYFSTQPARVLAGCVPGSDVPAYLVDAPELYRRAGSPYGDSGGRDWSDNHLRFALLGAVAAALAEGEIDLTWRAEVVHGHDWHSGLMPAYLAARGIHAAASVMTIHNLSFPGLFPAAAFRDLALPPRFSHPKALNSGDTCHS
jgi:starch synthase